MELEIERLGNAVGTPKFKNLKLLIYDNFRGLFVYLFTSFKYIFFNLGLVFVVFLISNFYLSFTAPYD